MVILYIVNNFSLIYILDKRKSRRKSSLFRPKTPDLTEEQPPKTPEKTPAKDAPPTTPNLPTPHVKSIGSMRKAVKTSSKMMDEKAAESPKSTRRSSRRRTVGLGMSPRDGGGMKMRIKRLSADPAALRETIKRYGRKLVKPELVQAVEQSEVASNEVIENAQPVTNPEPIVAAVVIEEHDDKENTAPELRVKTPEKISKLPLPVTPMGAANDGIVMRVENSPAQINVTPRGMFGEKSGVSQKAQSKTPNNAKAMKGLFNPEEVEAKKAFDARDTSVPITPGQTAMKGMVEQPVEKSSATPHNAKALKSMFDAEELAAKKVFDARDTSVPVTPGQTAMKGMFEQPVDKTAKTPNNAKAIKGMFDAEEIAAKKVFDARETSVPVTPGQTAMKGMFEQPVEKSSATPHNAKAFKGMFEAEEIEAKKVFDARDTSVPVTPGPTAMRLFDQPKETGMPTPASGTIKKLFESSEINCPVTPHQNMMKRTFQKNDSDHVTTKTPIQGKLTIYRHFFGGPEILDKNFEFGQKLLFL